MAEESKNKLIPTDEVIDAKIVAALEEPLMKISEHDKSLADKAESSSVYDKTTVDSKVKVLGDAVAEHVANNTRHISDSEREIWNNKPDSSEIYTRQQSDMIFASLSHEHTNDGWFVSVINAVKKLIPALPSWLTPTREEPPTKKEVASKANKPALPVIDGNLAALTADGNLKDSGKMASDFLPASSSFVGMWNIWDSTTFRGDFSVGPNGDILGVSYDHGSLYKFGDTRWYYGEETSDANEIAVKGDISALASSLDDKANSADIPGMVRETMSAEGISSSGINIGGSVSGQTVRDQYGDLREAINGKVGSFDSVGGASATVENGVAKLDDFFTNSNSLLTGTIDARLPYPLYAVPSTGLLKDRAINTTSLASVTVPDNFTDLLVRASVASSLSVTMPEAITTKYGDTFPGEAGEYLITITKTGAAEAYVRTIKLEEVA